LQTRWVRRCRLSTATTTKTIVLALIVFLALPSSAHAEDKLFTAVRIGVWTTQAMDLAVTQRVLGAGTGREANTLMGWTMRDPYVAAATKVGGALAIDYLLRQAHRRNRMAAIWTGIGVTTAYSFVLVHNRRVMTAGELGRR
jgi:ABC-type Fe3+-siderophore transport system permease subunit